jgi:regulatory protein YycH of two-component signal transduction system YycFG
MALTNATTDVDNKEDNKFYKNICDDIGVEFNMNNNLPMNSFAGPVLANGKDLEGRIRNLQN